MIRVFAVLRGVAPDTTVQLVSRGEVLEFALRLLRSMGFLCSQGLWSAMMNAMLKADTYVSKAEPGMSAWRRRTEPRRSQVAM
jgi:hypothetical protein